MSHSGVFFCAYLIFFFNFKKSQSRNHVTPNVHAVERSCPLSGNLQCQRWQLISFAAGLLIAAGGPFGSSAGLGVLQVPQEADSETEINGQGMLGRSPPQGGKGQREQIDLNKGSRWPVGEL